MLTIFTHGIYRVVLDWRSVEPQEIIVRKHRVVHHTMHDMLITMPPPTITTTLQNTELLRTIVQVDRKYQ